MNSDNVYETPESDLSVESENAYGMQYTGPKAVEFDRGVEWISRSWQIFKLAPVAWVFSSLILMSASVALSFIPYIGLMLSAILVYVCIAGLMLGCENVREGGDFSIRFLVSGFQKRRWSLLISSTVIYIIAFITFLVVVLFYFFTVITPQIEAQVGANIIKSNYYSIIFSYVLASLANLPLIMAAWFAPALIVLQQMTSGKAIKDSFIGCAKNIFPLLIYGLALVLMVVIALLPLGLGLLICIPLILISIFASYEDIFLTTTVTAKKKTE